MAQICSLFLLILLAFPPVQCVSSLTKNTEGNDSIRTADGKIADSRVLVNDPMKQLLFGDRKRHKKKPIHGSTDELEADADAAAAASDPNAAGLNDPIEMRQSRHGAKTHKLRKERRSSSGDNDFNMGHIRAHEGGRMGGRGGSRAGGRLGGRGRGVGRAGGRAGVRVTHPPGPGSRNHQQLAGHGPFGGQPFPTIGFTDLSMRAHPAPGFPGSHTQPKPLPLPQARPVPKDGEIVRGIWDNRQQRTPGGQLFKHEVRIYTDTHEKSLRAALPDKNNELPIKGMIFTAFLRSQKDPQRGKWIDASMSYIHNVYTSIRYLDLRATFFHDNCSDAFVNRYSTDKIQFRKIKVSQSFTLTDFRFQEYMRAIDVVVREQRITHVFMVDASDVFFWKDPFDYMSRRGDHSLFISPDIGTLRSNGWIVNKMRTCYKADVNRNASYELHNDGVWGGRVDRVKCVLQCMTEQFQKITKGRGNCNMAVYNWCINHYNCAPKAEIDHEKSFINPFRKECLEKHYVVHNKCQLTEFRVCMDVVDGQLMQMHDMYIKPEPCTKAYPGLENAPQEAIRRLAPPMLA